jgi:hypothetical protein
MKPKKGIKKHHIVDHEKELMELLNSISDSAQGIIIRFCSRDYKRSRK